MSVTDCNHSKHIVHSLGVLQLEYLLDGEHEDGSYDGDTDTGEHTQGRASDELVGVL